MVEEIPSAGYRLSRIASLCPRQKRHAIKFPSALSACNYVSTCDRYVNVLSRILDACTESSVCRAKSEVANQLGEERSESDPEKREIVLYCSDSIVRHIVYLGVMDEL